ncbi:hypothetical protein ABID29_002235 [Streptococcus rupicaprae]|uniref:Uncharacterized protein n=1 Tax=Streptococcus rupicaprae TaxID=759619 RepID=A0ABV2FKL1_9STRE
MKKSIVAFLKSYFVLISALLGTILLVPAEGFMMTIQTWAVLPFALLFWGFSGLVYLSNRSLF